MKNKNHVIVRAVIDQGLSHKQAADKYGVSRQWVHTLVTRYQLQGPQGLDPGSRSPIKRPNTTTEAVKQAIIELRHWLTQQGADGGPETIAWHLARQGLKPPSTSTIRRILHNNGMITPEPKKRPKSAITRFEAELPNQCWQTDITHWFLANGQRIEILDFLDDHSRLLLHIQAQHAFTGTDVVKAMEHLISKYGPPQSTLTDNGLVFTARLAGRKGGRNGFEKLLQAHHIHQKNGRPGHPQTQGKIERFHQTLKRWLKAKPRPTTIQELQQLLDQFRHWYNHQRPHRAIGRKTPNQAYQHLPKATPQPHQTPEWRTRTDIVDKDGKVTLRYAGKLRHLGIGRAWIGQPVLLLIKDNQVSTSLIETGQTIATHHIDPTRNYQAPIR